MIDKKETYSSNSKLNHREVRYALRTGTFLRRVNLPIIKGLSGELVVGTIIFAKKKNLSFLICADKLKYAYFS